MRVRSGHPRSLALPLPWKLYTQHLVSTVAPLYQGGVGAVALTTLAYL